MKCTSRAKLHGIRDNVPGQPPPPLHVSATHPPPLLALRMIKEDPFIHCFCLGLVKGTILVFQAKDIGMQSNFIYDFIYMN